MGIFLPVLKDLLLYTDRLSQLYPAPLENYGGLGAVHTERVSLHCAELIDTLRAIRQPKMVLFHFHPCTQCG
jgi:hypothetical protein